MFLIECRHWSKDQSLVNTMRERDAVVDGTDDESQAITVEARGIFAASSHSSCSRLVTYHWLVVDAVAAAGR